jgi:hypothetical protein
VITFQCCAQNGETYEFKYGMILFKQKGKEANEIPNYFDCKVKFVNDYDQIYVTNYSEQFGKGLQVFKRVRSKSSDSIYEMLTFNSDKPDLYILKDSIVEKGKIEFHQVVDSLSSPDLEYFIFKYYSDE